MALEDTWAPHDHAKKIPFVYRLFDHCSKAYVHAMNLVVLHAVKASGLQYPLFYSIWKQDNGEPAYSSKWDLALQLLQQLKSQVAEDVRLWVAMDSWYFVKDLHLAIEKLEFDWVARAKSSKTLYRRVVIRGHPRPSSCPSISRPLRSPSNARRFNSSIF